MISAWNFGLMRSAMLSPRFSVGTIAAGQKDWLQIGNGSVGLRCQNRSTRPSAVKAKSNRINPRVTALRHVKPDRTEPKRCRCWHDADGNSHRFDRETQ